MVICFLPSNDIDSVSMSKNDYIDLIYYCFYGDGVSIVTMLRTLLSRILIVVYMVTKLSCFYSNCVCYE